MIKNNLLSGVVLLALVLVLGVVPALAQEVPETVAGLPLWMAVVMVLPTVISLVLAVVVWVRLPQDRRTLSGLDAGVSERLAVRDDNREFITALERLVGSMNAQNQQTMTRVSELLLDAAKWMPTVETIPAMVGLIDEAVDGVPYAKKLEALEKRAQLAEAQIAAMGGIPDISALRETGVDLGTHPQARQDDDTLPGGAGTGEGSVGGG